MKKERECILSEKDFCRVIDELEKLDDKIENMNSALSELSEVSYNFSGFLFDSHINLILNLLELITHDVETQWIKYYIYELNYGKKWKKGYITFDGEDIKLKNSKDLYKILIDNIRIKRT